MASKVIRGCTLKWCKFNVVDQYGHYGCQVYLNDEARKKMIEIGLGKKVKKDEEGAYFFRARRREDDGPVPVVDKHKKPVTVAISNGATALVKLDVYEYKKYGGGITCRLQEVMVLDWEPYEEGEDFDPNDESSSEDEPF